MPGHAHDRIGFLAPRVPKHQGNYAGRSLAAQIRRMLPAGEARDTVLDWIAQGVDVSFFLVMGKGDAPGLWHIRVGDKELSIEEYLLLFDADEEGK